MIRTLSELVAPKSADEDLGRREFILNILLVSSIFLASISIVYMLVVDVYAALIAGSVRQGVSMISQVSIAIAFLLLYFFSRAGFFIQASYFLVGLYFVPTTYSLYTFGVDLPQGLLTYVLIIVLSGILVGTRFAYLMTAVISFTLAALTYVQLESIVFPKLYWRTEMFNAGDVVVFIITFTIIAIVSWLSNREMEAALTRARRSESDLKKERDSLEIRVEERTAELKKTQMEKMLQLYQFSEFGRLSAGLIHDLINPLTALSLNLDQVSSEVQAKSSKNVKAYVEQASLATKRMENYVQIARKQLQQQDVSDTFCPLEEIRQVNRMLEYKANAMHVSVRVIGSSDVSMFGNFIRFSQVMANIIANAIDAYEDCEDDHGKRRIDIRIKERKNGDVMISVQDWAAGIKQENISSVFEPFFTTKGYENGTGVGLFIVKQIVERDFHGTVSLKSEYGFGTTCIIIFPKNHDKKILEEGA